jgi:hypothetical protein
MQPLQASSAAHHARALPVSGYSSAVHVPFCRCVSCALCEKPRAPNRTPHPSCCALPAARYLHFQRAMRCSSSLHSILSDASSAHSGKKAKATHLHVCLARPPYRQREYSQVFGALEGGEATPTEQNGNWLKIESLSHLSHASRRLSAQLAGLDNAR